MLGLRVATDLSWAKRAEEDIGAILSDHAYCEQKAASNAITNIVKFADFPDIVEAMIAICKEELSHFEMVHNEIKKRGLQLGRERKDAYVNDLMAFVVKGDSREAQLVDRMLFSALIEARSCERFKLLSEHLSCAELRSFYRELMKSEAQHYTTFMQLATKHAHTVDVKKRWQAFLEYEASLMLKYGKEQSIHG